MPLLNREKLNELKLYLQHWADAPGGWRVLVDKQKVEEQQNKLITKLLKIIDKEYSGKKVRLVQVLESAKPFAQQIFNAFKQAGLEVELNSIKASSYVDGTRGELSLDWVENEGPIQFTDDEVVIIVDDMIDSGHTINGIVKEFLSIFEDEGVDAQVFAVVLLEKIGHLLDESIKYYKAIDMGKDWVAGYGINGNQPGELGTKDGRERKDIIRRLNNRLLRELDILFAHLHGHAIIQFVVKILNIIEPLVGKEQKDLSFSPNEE